jgi:hypothetical protein
MMRTLNAAGPLLAAIVIGSALPGGAAGESEGAPAGTGPAAATEAVTATDFSRSFCYYTPTEAAIWVRMQIECRCELFDSTGTRDEYLLTVRTQTGMWDKPSGPVDPGYDFWMVFSKKYAFIKRVRVSSLADDPSRRDTATFLSSGWHLQAAPATLLRSGADIRAALRAWRPVVARTEITSTDGKTTCAIEYPVKWADGNDDDTFRVETGPVLLLDPERCHAGEDRQFADFQWAYLDYHAFDDTRVFLEGPTSIFYDVTRQAVLTAEQVAQIEARLYSGWEPPVPAATLRQALETDHYSTVTHKKVTTKLYALE